MKHGILTFIIWSAIVISSASAQVFNSYYTIEEFNKAGLTFGTYHVVGYVAKTYSCPECTEQEVKCEPCEADYIVISEDKKTLENAELTEKELSIFVKEDMKFRLEGKYMFLIQILNVKTLHQMSNNVQLIYSERID